MHFNTENAKKVFRHCQKNHLVLVCKHISVVLKSKEDGLFRGFNPFPSSVVLS